MINLIIIIYITIVINTIFTTIKQVLKKKYKNINEILIFLFFYILLCIFQPCILLYKLICSLPPLMKPPN